MKLDFSNCRVEELWRYVSSHLEREEISTVLVGGAVVSVYTNDAYRSGDLDMVVSILISHKQVEKALAKIGFTKNGLRYYQHPECQHLYLDISTNIVSIGEQTHIQPDIWELDGVGIKILSPTDSVKDRLASYIHTQDSRDNLVLAAMVACLHPVDLDAIEAWCLQGKSSVNPGLAGQVAYQDFLDEWERQKSQNK